MSGLKLVWALFPHFYYKPAALGNVVAGLAYASRAGRGPAHGRGSCGLALGECSQGGWLIGPGGLDAGDQHRYEPIQRRCAPPPRLFMRASGNRTLDRGIAITAPLSVVPPS